MCYYEGMICGAVAQDGDEWRLTLYTAIEGRRHVVAIVIGSLRYVKLGLAAAGLGGTLTEDGDRWEAALVSSEPANGDAECLG